MSLDGPKSLGLLRAAPEPRLKAIPVDEALDIAKKAFQDARREQCNLLAEPVGQWLFDTGAVTYGHLLNMRGAARKQVERAQKVSQLIDDAIEAFKATAPVEPS